MPRNNNTKIRTINKKNDSKSKKATEPKKDKATRCRHIFRREFNPVVGYAWNKYKCQSCGMTISKYQKTYLDDDGEFVFVDIE